LQLTAFGARDRVFFESILCRAPSSAAEAQHVRPRIKVGQLTAINIPEKTLELSHTISYTCIVARPGHTSAPHLR